MSFLHINLKESYRSSEDNVIEKFYLPILKDAVLYRRAVGYFSSSDYGHWILPPLPFNLPRNAKELTAH